MLIQPTKKTAEPYCPSYIPEPPAALPLAFVAQSPGKNEMLKLIPLVGASGQLLERICVQAKIDFQRCFRGNVVGFHPDGNDFKTGFCAKKGEVGGKAYTLPPISTGAYLKPKYLPELDRLKAELEAYKPNLVVALGNEALWALTGEAGITKYRGTIMESSLVPGLKVLPTFHPANIFRAYENRVYLVIDLMKAKIEMETPEIKRTSRKIHLYPENPLELYYWLSQQPEAASDDSLCSVDIEDITVKGKKYLTCIGFAFNSSSALVVPFWSELREKNNYWQSLDDEIQAWVFVAYMLKTYPILGQNFAAYDAWVLIEEMGLAARRLREDTMILHHCFEPEMKKGLGVLSSIYCIEPAYKTMRARGKKSTKRDE